MVLRAYRVAYDGGPYHGFQRQPDVPTVEDAIFDALRALEVLGGDADKPPGYAAAGRTDAGVSALAQTVAFEAPEWLTPHALNGALPRDVRAWAHADAPAGFHATHDAVARTYRYHLHEPGASLGLAEYVAETLEGEHDVHNLTTDDEGTVRRVESVDVERAGPDVERVGEDIERARADADRTGEFVVVTVRAPGFCRHQVRRSVSLLRLVATGERPREFVEEALGDAELTGADGVPPAPAYPLVLVDVEYPTLDFVVDEDAVENAREVFGGKRVEHRSRAAVAGTVASGVRDDE